MNTIQRRLDTKFPPLVFTTLSYNTNAIFIKYFLTDIKCH